MSKISSVNEPPAPQDDYDPKGNARDQEKAGASVAKSLIKSEMAKRNMTYKGLVSLMHEHGIEEDERNLRNKVSRGGFTAGWFFSIMMMMEVKNLDVSHFYKTLAEVWDH